VSRTLLNFILDTLLLVTFLSMGVTGVVVRFVFPPGTQADGWTLWGSGYDAWVGLWFNILAALAVMVLVHVMLHWSWVCGVVAQRISKRLGRTVRIDEANQTLYGVGLLVVLFTASGIVVGAAQWSIREGRRSTTESSPAEARAPVASR
jgi:tetrahydromethanopterin S-methyltransferase subunit G